MRKSEKSAEYLFAENSVTAQVLAVLGTGEANATASRSIKRAFGLSERDLRKIVEKSRRAGIYVLSSERGYFYPKDVSEVRQFVKRENARIRSQCKTLASIKRLLKSLDSG